MGSQLSFSSKQAIDANHRFNDFGVHLYNAHSAFLWRKSSNEATGDDREGDQPMICGYIGSLRAVSAAGRRRRSLVVVCLNGDP
jgi:hypothetical protein